MEDILARYRGNYIAEMRKDVGHAPLMVTSCGIIIENDKGEIQNCTEEALEHRFFGQTNLPDNINEYDRRIIIDWTKNFQQVIVD